MKWSDLFVIAIMVLQLGAAISYGIQKEYWSGVFWIGCCIANFGAYKLAQIVRILN